MVQAFLDAAADHYAYWIVIALMMTGLYVVMTAGNLVKKIVGLNIFQTSVFMLYISMGKITGGTAPILTGDPATVYSNPLPHVLILTAIVVGIATTALGLALIVRIQEAYGTIEEDELETSDVKQEYVGVGEWALDQDAPHPDHDPSDREPRA